MAKKVISPPPEREVSTGEILSKVDTAFEGIAAELEVPVEVVRNAFNFGQGKSFSRKIKKYVRENIICQMRAEKKSNTEIAAALGVPYYTVAAMASELIAQGKLTPYQHGLPVISAEEEQRREELVIGLWNENQSRKAIATEIKLSVATVSKVLTKLFKEGRIAKRQRIDSKMRQQRIDILKPLKRNRATLAEMGQALGGVTRERARQILKKLGNDLKDDVPEPGTALLTLKEASKKLSVSTWLVKQLCKDGDIQHQFRNKEKKKGVLISESEVERLKAHPLIARNRSCVVCGKSFTYSVQEWHRKTCSDACADERHTQLRVAYSQGEPDIKSLEGWHKTLFEKLKTPGIIKEDEEWVSFERARKITGLTGIRLYWLRYRNIVASRPDPVRTWRGQPMKLFSMSEMKIVKRVFKAFYKAKAQNRDAECA